MSSLVFPRGKVEEMEGAKDDLPREVVESKRSLSGVRAIKDNSYDVRCMYVPGISELQAST